MDSLSSLVNFTTCQWSCGKVMFSVVSVWLSVILSVSVCSLGGPHLTTPHMHMFMGPNLHPLKSNLSICWNFSLEKAGRWPSTEMPSCLQYYWTFWDNIPHLWFYKLLCKNYNEFYSWTWCMYSGQGSAVMVTQPYTSSYLWQSLLKWIISFV